MTDRQWANVLNREIQARGLSYEQAAAQIGVTGRSVSRWIRDRVIPIPAHKRLVDAWINQ